MRRILLWIGWLVAAPLLAAQPLKIHIISGSDEYKSGETLTEYKKFLEDNYNVQVSASWVTDGAVQLPEVEKIKDADVLLVFARRLKLPEEQMALVRKHWEDGKGMIGIRTASHAFSNEENTVFDRKVLGGNYVGHFGNEDVTVIHNDAAKDHPVLKDVGAFKSRRLYKAGELAASATVLQRGEMEMKDGKKVQHSVSWVNE